MNKVNSRLKKVKGLVRLAKAWKNHVDAPISSFYLEMRVAEYAEEQSEIIYDIDLRYAMKQMLRTELRDMNDPAGLVGRIPACSSQDNRSAGRRLMEDAVTDLEAAYECEKARDKSGYWGRMTEVFGYDYPWPNW